jgi:hypothetical protein
MRVLRRDHKEAIGPRGRPKYRGAQQSMLDTLIGFDAVDLGDLKAARYLELFAMTGIHMAILLGHGRSFACARLRR